MGHGAWVDYLRNLLLECSSVATPAPLPALCIVRPCQWRIRPAAIHPHHDYRSAPGRSTTLERRGAPDRPDRRDGGRADDLQGGAHRHQPRRFCHRCQVPHDRGREIPIRPPHPRLPTTPACLGLRVDDHHAPACMPPPTTHHNHPTPTPPTACRYPYRVSRPSTALTCTAVPAMTASLSRVLPEQQACDRELGAWRRSPYTLSRVNPPTPPSPRPTRASMLLNGTARHRTCLARHDVRPTATTYHPAWPRAHRCSVAPYRVCGGLGFSLCFVRSFVLSRRGSIPIPMRVSIGARGLGCRVCGRGAQAV